MPEQIACGSGLELIYEFLLTDEPANRPDLMRTSRPKVRRESGEPPLLNFIPGQMSISCVFPPSYRSSPACPLLLLIACVSIFCHAVGG